MPPLTELYYDDTSLPRDSLSRAAEKVKRNGALYIGGGIGVEQTKDERFRVLGAGSTHDGPLSAVTAAFKAAGGKSAEGTPGGAAKVTEPAIAARLWELDAQVADCEAQIARMRRTLARNAKQPVATYSGYPSGGLAADDMRWEQRRINELAERKAQLERERTMLVAGKVKEAAVLREAAEVGKPGTNWKQVKGADRKRINPIVAHYAKMAHPFTACVRDNRKRFGDRAERVCAVVKDMGARTTKWRKGGAKEAEIVDRHVDLLLEAAGGDVDALEAMMLAHIVEAEAARAPEDTDEARRQRRRRRSNAKKEAVVGRTDAGVKGDVDAPDAAVGEAAFWLS